MGYYRNDDGCLLILLGLPIIAAWNILKFILAVAACCLVVPVRIIWLMITIPVNILTGDDHTADWEDGDFMSAMWGLFFPSR